MTGVTNQVVYEVKTGAFTKIRNLEPIRQAKCVQITHKVRKINAELSKLIKRTLGGGPQFVNIPSQHEIEAVNFNSQTNKPQEYCAFKILTTKTAKLKVR